MFLRISTFYKKLSYFSLFLAAESFTMLLKVSLSSFQITYYVSDLIVAALGALYKSASSPNPSPG